MRRIGALVVSALLGGYLLWPSAFTVVPIARGTGASQGFDPVIYVDGVWDRIGTTIHSEGIDLAELLAAIPADADGLVAKDALVEVTDDRFGTITAGEAHVYMVHATGTVRAIDTSTSVGTLELAVAGYEGPITVEVYVGPRIPSDDSSVRDAVGFLSFGDFKDQTEYGKVASEINDRVVEMLATVDAAGLQGKTVTVVGALTVRTFNLLRIDVSTLHIVPVAVEPS